MTIGENIKKKREERGLSQVEVADRCGVSAQFISNIESGKKKISTNVLLGLANLFVCSTDEILGRNVS